MSYHAGRNSVCGLKLRQQEKELIENLWVIEIEVGLLRALHRNGKTSNLKQVKLHSVFVIRRISKLAQKRQAI